MFEYSTVKFSGFPDQREKPFAEGIARKFNSWGDSLIKPLREAYNGRTYEVIVFVSRNDRTKCEAYIREEKDLMPSPKRTLSCSEKIRGFIGSLFKKIAAFICRDIRSEYEAAEKGDTNYFANKRTPQDMTPRPEGRSDGFRIGPSDPVSQCCNCCFAMCDLIGSLP